MQATVTNNVLIDVIYVQCNYTYVLLHEGMNMKSVVVRLTLEELDDLLNGLGWAKSEGSYPYTDIEKKIEYARKKRGA